MHPIHVWSLPINEIDEKHPTYRPVISCCCFPCSCCSKLAHSVLSYFVLSHIARELLWTTHMSPQLADIMGPQDIKATPWMNRWFPRDLPSGKIIDKFWSGSIDRGGQMHGMGGDKIYRTEERWKVVAYCLKGRAVLSYSRLYCRLKKKIPILQVIEVIFNIERNIFQQVI